MGVRLVVLRCGDAKEMEARLGLAFGDEATLSHFSSETPLHFEKPENFPKLSGPRAAAVEAADICARHRTYAMFPMVAGEKLLGQTTSYLVKDFQAIPKMTPVIIRETDRSTVAFLFTHSMVKGDKIEQFENKPFVYQPPAAEKEIGLMADIGLSIAKALAGAIAEKIFAELFPPDVPGYFAQVYEEMKKIVKQALDQLTIDNTNAKLEGIIRFMRQEYIPKKDSFPTPLTEDHKRYLDNMLQSYDHDFWTSVLALLMADRYRIAAVSHFVDAANTHMALLQERARVDPFVNQPADSSFTTTCKIVAENYANHLQKCVDDIYAYREACLTEPIVFHHWYPDPYSAPVDEWHFEDHYTGYRSPIFVKDLGTKDVKTGEEKVKAARARYYNDTFEPAIVSDLAGWRAIILEWRKIYHAAQVKAK